MLEGISWKKLGNSIICYSPYSFHRMMIKWIGRWNVSIKSKNCILFKWLRKTRNWCNTQTVLTKHFSYIIKHAYVNNSGIWKKKQKKQAIKILNSSWKPKDSWTSIQPFPLNPSYTKTSTLLICISSHFSFI